MNKTGTRVFGGCDFERKVTSCDTTLTVRSHWLYVTISNKRYIFPRNINVKKWDGGGGHLVYRAELSYSKTGGGPVYTGTKLTPLPEP